MTYFILGVILGLLLNPVKEKFPEKYNKLIQEIENRKKEEKSQFFEPITEEEKFLSAKTISDNLKNE